MKAELFEGAGLTDASSRELLENTPEQDDAEEAELRSTLALVPRRRNATPLKTCTPRGRK